MSDVVRLYALYTEGGIYFDTDVEVRKNFDDFLNADFFIGSEKSGHFESIGTGIIGAQKGNKIIKKLLDFYQTAEFIKPNGKPDLTANTVRLVPIFKSLGLKKVYTHNTIVSFDENAFLYPDTYFCVDNPDCFSVHHFEGSWGDDWELRFDLSLPLGKSKSLCLKRYKQKREKPFIYPAQTLKQLAELNCKKTRKWTLTIEKTKN